MLPKNRITKLSLLFGLYIVLHFVAASCDTNCHCGHVAFPYFDYHILTVTANDPIAASALKLDVAPADVSFIATAENHGSGRRGFDFIPTALGCDCSGNGAAGPKYPLVAFNVFADRAFSDLLPAGSSLTSLFKFSEYDSLSNQEYSLSRPTIENYGALRLTTTEWPKNPELPIRFTIQVIKSNQDTVSIQTDTIRFQ